MILNYKFNLYVKHPRYLWRDLTNPIRWAWQRLTRGWDDRVIWSIDYYLAEMMPVWLRKLAKDKQGIPASMYGSPINWFESNSDEDDAAEQRWNGILHEMIEGFEAAKRIIDYDKRDGDIQRAARALQLLEQYFFDLWD